jgi:CRP-like cAMP-binding protein
MMSDSNFNAFSEHINKIIPVSDEIWAEIEFLLSFRELKKDEIIVKEGQSFNKEIFVNHGIIRSFYKSREGFELNISFYRDNEIICPWFSRTRNGKSIVNLKTITPCTIFEMEQDKFKALRYKYRELLYYGSMVVEKELEIKTQREMFLLIDSAHERYLMFRKMYPQLENRIPQFQIASFLGITPVSLSRLRKQMHKK